MTQPDDTDQTAGANKYPVDSRTRACCGTIGGHSFDCDQHADSVVIDLDPPEPQPFEGDRYERLRRAAEILGAGESVASGNIPYNSEGLLAFAESVAQLKLMDGLTDSDANHLTMFAVLDFTRGPQHMAWRIGNLLSDHPDVPCQYENEMAVIHAYVGLLHMLLGCFAAPSLRARLSKVAAEVNETHEAARTLAVEARDGADSSRYVESASHLVTAQAAIADAIGALR